MAYKFQLGTAILSGTLNVKGDLTASTDVSGALVNISASNFLVAGGLQLQRVTASAGFFTTGSDGILWLNARDGKVVAITPENLAVGLAGDGLLATTGSVVVNVDDSTINIDADKIQVKDLGIASSQLASGSVTRAKIGGQAVNVEQLSGDVAGAGLDGGNGVALKLDVSTISTVLTGSAIDGSDLFGLYDEGAGAQKKSSVADLAVKLAGNNITATDGVLAVTVTSGGDSMTSTAIGDGDKLTAGINYFTGTIQPSAEFVEVSLPEASAPTVGDTFYVKAPSNCGSSNRVHIEVSGTHKMDGMTRVILDDPYATVGFVYVISGSYSII